jgi:hypothetical protein
MYFVVGNQLWVIYQILYVKNVILASADLTSGAGGATAHAVELFGGLPMVFVRVFASEKINLSFAVPNLKTLWNSRLFKHPSMIPKVNFSRLSLIQVEIHLSCWMNLRVKALIHNCIWEGLFCNYLVISVYFRGEISPYFHPKAQLLPLSLKKPNI